MKQVLSEYCIITTGHVFRSKISYTPEGNINLVDTDAISTTGNICITKENVKKVIANKLKDDEILKEKDILFKAKGLNNNAVIIGKVPQDTIATSSCHIIRVNDNRLLPEYLCLCLNSNSAKKHFSKNSGQATGVTIANVSKATLESLPIYIPPIKIQKLYANIAECSKIEQELLTKIKEKKELLNQAIIEKELNKLGDYNNDK